MVEFANTLYIFHFSATIFVIIFLIILHSIENKRKIKAYESIKNMRKIKNKYSILLKIFTYLLSIIFTIIMPAFLFLSIKYDIISNENIPDLLLVYFSGAIVLILLSVLIIIILIVNHLITEKKIGQWYTPQFIIIRKYGFDVYFTKYEITPFNRSEIIEITLTNKIINSLSSSNKLIDIRFNSKFIWKEYNMIKEKHNYGDKIRLFIGIDEYEYLIDHLNYS